MDPLTSLAEDTNSDVYVHSGNMEPPADDRIITLAAKPRRDKAYLFVATYGGLAGTAYRIMRSLQHAYTHVTVVVGGPCKSAGTLLVIGADELVMTGNAELGPLDVQLLKDDDLVERQSGLTPGAAFGALTAEARRAFQNTFIDLKYRGRLTTATAASTAANLTIGLFAPIFAQIDPIRVGEVSMANLVAHKYATELSKRENGTPSIANPASIVRLLSGYPSHDYVIDRTEAKALFSRVRHPNETEWHAINELRPLLAEPASQSVTHRHAPAPGAPNEREDPSDHPDPGGQLTEESAEPKRAKPTRGASAPPSPGEK